MSIFNKKNECVARIETINTNERSAEVALKERDLKQFIVDNFKTIDDRDNKIMRLKEELEKFKIQEREITGYKATANELLSKNKRLETEVDAKQRSLDYKSETIKGKIEEVNNLTIENRKLKSELDILNQSKDKLRNSIQEEVIKKYKEKLSEEVRKTKGNMAKEKVIELINFSSTDQITDMKNSNNYEREVIR